MIVAAASLAALCLPGASHAQDAPSDSPLKAALKIVGFATDVSPPPDFVRQSRPAQTPPSIRVFNQPPEPPAAVKSADEIAAIHKELEDVAKRHDALRAAFPPSAKAVADAAAARAAKAKTKGAQKSPIPTF